MAGRVTGYEVFFFVFLDSIFQGLNMKNDYRALSWNFFDTLALLSQIQRKNLKRGAQVENDTLCLSEEGSVYEDLFLGIC